MTNWGSSVVARTMLRIVAVAIALVVGRAPEPRALRASSEPVVCSAERPAKADALRAGERAEPRIAPAPEAVRAVRMPALFAEQQQSAGFASTAVSVVPYAETRHQRLIVVQRVPRLEPGEPPRVV